MSRRIAVLTGGLLVLYGAYIFRISTDTHGAAASSLSEQFRADFLVPALVDLAKCVMIEGTEDGWLELRYIDRAGCAAATRWNPVLEVIASPGRHLYREGQAGSQEFVGLLVDLGPAPRHSPGFSICFEHGTKTLLLNPHNGLGYLGQELMSAGNDSPVDAAELFSHETGHFVHGCSSDTLQSNSDAVSVENWYLSHRDSSSQVRRFHDPPPVKFLHGRAATK